MYSFGPGSRIRRAAPPALPALPARAPALAAMLTMHSPARDAPNCPIPRPGEPLSY